MADPFARVAALPGVEEAVAEARAAVDRLLSHRILRRRSAEVTAESALRSARASAALELVDVPLELLRSALSDAGDPADAGKVAVPAGGPVVEGALRVTAGLGELLTIWERAPRQALARLHVLAARGLMPDAALGQPRGLPTAVAPGWRPLAGDEVSAGDASPASEAARAALLAPDDPLGLGQPPSPSELGARLDGLADLLLAPTSAGAIVVAAIVHGELLAIRPFGHGDGLVARAAARLVLIGRGLDPKAVTAPEVGHVELGDYAAAAGGYVHGGPAGLAAWVIHCARATELGAREGLAVCEALLRAA